MRLKRSTFFYHLAEKTNKDAGIFHENNGNCSYRRISLLSCRVWTNNHTKAQVIMQKLGLKGKCKRWKYCSYQGEMGKIIIFWKPLTPNFEQISRMMYQTVERLDGTKPILHFDRDW